MLMIESIVRATAGWRVSPDLQRLLDGIGGPNYRAVSKANAWEIGCDFDDPARRKMIYETYVLPPCEKIPQQAAYSTIKNFTQNYDPTPAAEACKIPMAYISADVPLVNVARDLDRLLELCPQLVVAKTMLAGHFNTIEVADQVNAMLDRFLAICLALAVRSVVPAIAAEQVPSCDLFRARLVEAPKLLSLWLPSLQLHREPPDHQDDVWKTDGMRAEDSGELWYTTGVYCRAGKFREVSTDIDVPSGPLHPTFDLALLWQIFAIDLRNWIPESDFP